MSGQAEGKAEGADLQVERRHGHDEIVHQAQSRALRHEETLVSPEAHLDGEVVGVGARRAWRRRRRRAVQGRAGRPAPTLGADSLVARLWRGGSALHVKADVARTRE